MDIVNNIIRSAPVPIILYDGLTVVEISTGFEELTGCKDLRGLDLGQCLLGFFKAGEVFDELIKGVKEKRELHLDIVGYKNGNRINWKVHSFPFIHTDGSCRQITWFIDNTSHAIKEAYWDLQVRINLATNEIVRRNTDLEKMEIVLKNNLDLMHLINSLLHLALKNMTLDVLLKKALDLILQAPGLSIEAKGAIFLVGEAQALDMKAQKGLSPYIQQSCRQVPVGKCLCGRAVSTKEIEFASTLDERHEIRYEGIKPHGHYCVPIISSGKVLGVLTTYLKEGYQRKEADISFLKAVTGTLAGMIERSRVTEELFAMQAELIQSEKLATLGTFSAGIAHEVRNPMGVILGGAEFLEKKMVEADDDTRMVLAKIKEAVIKSNETLRTLLEYARPAERKVEKINPIDLVKGVLSFLRYKDTYLNIKINTEFSADGIFINVDKNQMHQAIFNIMKNSFEAMPKGGVMTIRVFEERSTCVIEIIDNGVGIAKEVMAKISKPFFTTKGRAVGTGLGLFVTKTIIENNKGKLIIESEEGKGALVKVVLPCCDVTKI